MAARIGRLSTCATKVGYPSPQAAWAALQRIDQRTRKRHSRKRSREGQERVYRCDRCHRWHITAGVWGTLDDLD